MDLYRCDMSFKPVDIIDDYESLIWTDRYVGAGDFKLVVREDHMLMQNLNSFLQCSESNRMMMIETVDIKRQEAGKGQINKVEITGRGVEAFFTMRNSIGMSYGQDPEQFTGTVGSIGKQIVDKYCINSATAGPANVIPNLVAVNIYGSTSTQVIFERGPIYDQLNTLALAYGCGWIIHINDPGKMTFSMISGIDKTDPTDSYYRVYSADEDTLLNTSTLNSTANFKNHVRIIGYKVGADVYAPGYSAATVAWDRRTMVILAKNIGDDSTSAAQDNSALVALAKKALADNANRNVHMIDGEVPSWNWNDIYFGLGDVVWVKDTYGQKMKARITESIITSDSSNDVQRIPTFDQFEA